MKKIVLSVLAVIILSGMWGGLRFFALMEGWLLEPWAETENTVAFAKHLESEVNDNFKGNAAYALIERGEIVNTHFVSTGKPVDEQSVFGVASVGKWVTAMAVMRLVEQGILDLDAPVSQYLKRWQLPQSKFDNEQMTLRLLLSHTAGIEDGLGHDGFAPGELIQPLTEHLTKAADADPGVSGRVAALVPKPRVNLTRYHGVLAPNHRWRGLVTPARRGKGIQSISNTEFRTPAERHAAMTWAQRLKRVFNIDIEVCGRCGGSVRVIACIEDQDIIDRILTHLRQKEQETPTRPLLVPPTRAPPGTLPLFAGKGAR